VKIPGTPLLASAPWAAPAMAIVGALVAVGVLTRPAALGTGIGAALVMVAGIAAGKRFTFEPARHLVLSCIFIAIGGSGQLALRPTDGAAAPGRAEDVALTFLRVTAGVAAARGRPRQGRRGGRVAALGELGGGQAHVTPARLHEVTARGTHE